MQWELAEIESPIRNECHPVAGSNQALIRSRPQVRTLTASSKSDWVSHYCSWKSNDRIYHPPFMVPAKNPLLFPQACSTGKPLFQFTSKCDSNSTLSLACSRNVRRRP